MQNISEIEESLDISPLVTVSEVIVIVGGIVSYVQVKSLEVI